MRKLDMASCTRLRTVHVGVTYMYMYVISYGSFLFSFNLSTETCCSVIVFCGYEYSAQIGPAN